MPNRSNEESLLEQRRDMILNSQKIKTLYSRRSTGELMATLDLGLMPPDALQVLVPTR